MDAFALLAAADQRSVVDLLEKEGGERDSQRPADEAKHTQTRVADAAFELADQSGADAGEFGELLDGKVLLLPVLIDFSADPVFRHCHVSCFAGNIVRRSEKSRQRIHVTSSQNTQKPIIYMAVPCIRFKLFKLWQKKFQYKKC